MAIITTETNAPKVLLYDIETMANKAYVWGKYEQNVLSYEQETYMLCFAYKWLGQKRTYVPTLPDFKGYKKDKTNDKALVQKLHDLFTEADIVIGHNSDAFDNKKSNARFVYHGFSPPAPYQSIDTLKVARRYFKLNSNKLDDLGSYLKLGRKVQHQGWDLWMGCAVRDEKKSWNLMKKYNIQDVNLLEKVYLKLRPWMTNHPNTNLYEGTLNSCPTCGSDNMQKRGQRMTRTTVSQRYQCMSCSAWSSSPISKNELIIR